MCVQILIANPVERSPHSRFSSAMHGVVLVSLRLKQTSVENPENLQGCCGREVGCASRFSEQTMSRRSRNLQLARAASRAVLSLQRCTKFSLRPCDLGNRRWKILRFRRGFVDEKWHVYASFRANPVGRSPQFWFTSALHGVVLVSLRLKQTSVENPENLQVCSRREVGCACNFSEQTMPRRSLNLQLARAASRVVCFL